MNTINEKDEIKEYKKSFNIKGLLNMDLKDLKINLSKKSFKTNKINMPQKKKKIVAFDMGSSTIKIVEGMYYKGDLAIDKYIIVPAPKGAIVDGEIKKEEELYARLNQVLIESNIKAKDAICTTNSTLIINREILIPKVEKDEIDTVVRYEIQQYLPINLEDYILQVTMLGEKAVDETKKLSVRVIAYPEKIARGYYNLLLKLNLKPYALDVNYNAINKFINLTGLTNEFEYKSEDSVAFIDMGANFIDVNIYKSGQLDFTRIIKNGGNDIDEILLNRNNIEASEVKKFKIESISLEEDNIDSLSIEVKNTIDDWVEKIEKIIQFYKNRNIGNGVNHIIIFGGSSKIKGIEAYMTEKLGIKTKRKKISKLTFKSNDDGKPVDDFINVIGSAIRI